MRGRLLGAFLTGGVFVAAQTGCTSLSLFHPSSQLVESTAGVEVPAKNDMAELPPKQKASAQLMTATLLAQQGRIDDAIVYYEAARKVDPALQKEVCRRLGVLYDLTAQYPKADAEYQIALSLEPKNSDLHNDVGISYQTRGNQAEAERYFQKAVSLNPENKKAWNNLGITLAKLDKREESLAAFAKVVPLAQAHSNLGMILSQQGKSAEAIAELRQAVMMAPELQVAVDALRTLEEDPAKQAQMAKMSAAAAVKTANEEKLLAKQEENGGGFAESRELPPTVAGATAIEDGGYMPGPQR